MAKQAMLTSIIETGHLIPKMSVVIAIGSQATFDNS
jgi:hypothetical protein